MLGVSDSGIGIAGENLERVFEPFTQSHGGLAGGSSGLGLGLSVVRRVLELHGGRVKASSMGPRRGSEFVVWLPVLVTDDADTPQPANPRRPVPVETLHSRKVLLVDDHEEITKSLGRVVRSLGHEVAVARDGPSALALAHTFQPDCAIVDISLEGMHGIDLARRLRETFSRAQLYLIALTGFGGRDMREACLLAGFDEYLVKPGEIATLARLLGGERPRTGDASSGPNHHSPN